VRLLVGALSADVSRDGTIIVKPDPFCLLVEPTADGDMEVRYFPIVEDITHGWLVECGLIVEDLLLQMVELVLIPFCRYGGVGLTIGDSLEEAVSDTSEKGGVQVWLGL